MNSCSSQFGHAQHFERELAAEAAANGGKEHEDH